MGNNDTFVGESMRNQIIISHLKECIYSDWFIILFRHPSANGSKSRKYITIWFNKKFCPTLFRPFGKLIGSCINFITNFFYAKNFFFIVIFY